MAGVEAVVIVVVVDQSRLDVPPRLATRLQSSHLTRRRKSRRLREENRGGAR